MKFGWGFLFSLFALPAFAADLSAIKVAPDGNVRSIAIQDEGFADSKKNPERPCVRISLQDPDLLEGALNRVTVEGDADFISLKKDSALMCLREKTINLNLWTKNNDQISEHHYSIELATERPMIWVRPECEKDGLNAKGEIYGNHLAVALYCDLLKNSSHQMRYVFRDTGHGSTEGVLNANQTQTAQITSPNGKSSGAIELQWVQEGVEPPRAFTGKDADLSVFLGLAYHSHQNSFVNSMIGSQTFTGIQTRVEADGFKRSDLLGGIIFHGNVQGDFLSKSLLNVIRGSATIQKRIFGQESEVYVGIGGSYLSMFGDATYGVRNSFSPTLEIMLKQGDPLQVVLTYAPFISTTVAPADALISLLAMKDVRWFGQDLKAGLAIDYFSAKATTIGGIANYKSFGGALMLGKSFGK